MEASLGSVIGTTTSELASVPMAVVDMAIPPSDVISGAIAASVDEGIGSGLGSMAAGSAPVDIALPSDAIIVESPEDMYAAPDAIDGRSEDMYAVLEAAIPSVVVAAGISSAGIEVKSDTMGAASVIVELMPSDATLWS